MKIKRKTVIILALSLLLLSSTVFTVLAEKRAPPYANAKTYALPLPSGYASADADVIAKPGYGRARLLAVAHVLGGMEGEAYASSYVEFNADPLPGNSPALSWAPRIYAETYFHIKGTIIDVGGAQDHRLIISCNVYYNESGHWEFYGCIYRSFRNPGDYNSGHVLGKCFDVYAMDIEEFTVTAKCSDVAAASCRQGPCPELYGAVDFYSEGYPYKYIYVPYLELWLC